jgi:hypothetical protein
LKSTEVEFEEEKKYIDSIKRRERIFWIGAASLLLSASYLFDYLLSKIFVYSEILGVVGGFLVGIGFLFYWYLQGRPMMPISVEDTSVDKMVQVKELIFQLDFVLECTEIYSVPNAIIDGKEKQRISKVVKSTFDNVRKSWLTQDLNVFEDEASLDTDIGRKLLVSRAHQLRNWLADRMSMLKKAEEAGIREIEKARDRNRLLVERTHNRLSTEIRQLTGRANGYLVVGSIATIVAASYLYMSAPDAIREFNLASAANSSSVEFMRFVPLITRVAIAFAIEIFAFYFLKLHKEVMDNVKYYQNEITNVDLKAIALNAAYSVSENNGLKSVVDELSKAERNFILGDKQTTVELEKLRFEKSSLSEVLDKLTGILKSK